MFGAAHKPYIESISTSVHVPDTGPTVFMTPFGDNVQAAAAEFALGRDWERCYLIWDEADTYSDEFKQFFVAAYEGQGGLIPDAVAIDHIGSGTSFTAAELAAIVDPIAALLTNADPSDDPDVLAISTYLPDSTAIAAALRAAGVDLPIVGGDGWDDGELYVDGMGDIYYTNHAFTGDGRSVEYDRYLTAFRAAFGDDPLIWAGLAYDSVNLAISAIKRADSLDGAAILTALANTQAFAGVTGTIGFAGGSRIPAKSVFVVEVDGPTQVLAESFVPAVVPDPDVLK